MRDLISSPSSSVSLQGTMQAQQNLQREKERQQKRSEVAERERILVEGGNPDQELLKRQRVEGFKKKRESFEHRQRERQVAIVARLLEEAKAQRKSEKKMAKAHWQQVSLRQTFDRCFVVSCWSARSCWVNSRCCATLMRLLGK